MEMGANAILCRRNTLCRRSDDICAHHVQKARAIQHGRRLIHQLALPAVGHQTFLEPIRGHH